MKKSIDDILKSVRMELEKGFKDAVTQIDQRARKDFQVVSDRLKKLKDEELRLAERKFTDVRESIQSGEAFRPYMAALDAAIKTYREVKTGKPRKAKKAKRKTSKKAKSPKKKAKRKVAKKKTTKKKASKKKVRRKTTSKRKASKRTTRRSR